MECLFRKGLRHPAEFQIYNTTISLKFKRGLRASAEPWFKEKLLCKLYCKND